MKWADGGEAVHGVEVTGRPDGQTLVFVHGAVFQRQMWAPQREALAEEFQIVTLDLPGHGERDGREFDLQESLALLDDVFETQVEDSAVLIGLSLGGYVATAYVGHNPDAVEGLVISGSSVNPTGVLDPITRGAAGIMRLLTWSDRIEAKIEDLAAEWVRRRNLAPEMEAEIIDAGFYPRQFGVAGPQLAGRDFRGVLGTYAGPVLVFNGKWDLVNRLGEDDHAAAPGHGSVEVLQDSGHTVNLERPTAYTDVVRQFSREVLPDHAPGVEGE